MPLDRLQHVGRLERVEWGVCGRQECFLSVPDILLSLLCIVVSRRDHSLFESLCFVTTSDHKLIIPVFMLLLYSLLDPSSLGR